MKNDKMKNENKCIVNALELISGEDVSMGKVMDRVKIMYTAVLCRAMAQMDTVTDQDRIISNFIGSSHEVLTALREIKEKEGKKK